MDVNGASVVVTGGASGLGAATAARLAKQGAHVVIIDLPQSKGAEVAKEIGGQFGPADVTDTDAVNAALDLAEAKAPLRALVHCAGRGATVRVVEKDSSPGSMETYEEIVRSTSSARSTCCVWPPPGWRRTTSSTRSAACAC